MKFVSFLSLMLVVMFFANTATAQSKGGSKSKANTTKSNSNKAAANQKAEEIKGILKEKPWTKSEQSYCARGSEYFVLVEANGTEHVLDFTKYSSPAEQWKKWANKEVAIKGMFETRIIEFNDNNSMEQRIVTPNGPDGKPTNYSCTTFTVKSINPVNNKDANTTKTPSKSMTPSKKG
jgi:uncharacterized protein YutD